MKRIAALIWIAAALLTLLCGCGKSAADNETPEPAAAETVAPSGEASAAPAPSGEASAAPAPTPTPTPAPTPEPTPSPTPEPTPESTPAPTPLPLVAGTFTGSDGSILTVEADGTCTYETTLTGTVNNIRAEGRITFYGTVEHGVFSFTKVMYYGLDVTEIGRANGYTSYSYWEKAAAVIYAGGIG